MFPVSQRKVERTVILLSSGQTQQNRKPWSKFSFFTGGRTPKYILCTKQYGIKGTFVLMIECLTNIWSMNQYGIKGTFVLMRITKSVCRTFGVELH